MSDEVYDESRARNLEAMLAALARRILELEARGQLLPHAGDLLEALGNCRSEIFHYCVRVTYDTPEIAEHRRIVADASTPAEDDWSPGEWKPGEGEDPAR